MVYQWFVFILFIYCCVCVLIMYMWMPMESRRGCQILWSWSIGPGEQSDYGLNPGSLEEQQSLFTDEPHFKYRLTWEKRCLDKWLTSKPAVTFGSRLTGLLTASPRSRGYPEEHIHFKYKCIKYMHFINRSVFNLPKGLKPWECLLLPFLDPVATT